MFGSIGLIEILIIMGIALVVVGPEKFPAFAKVFLRTFRDIQKYIFDIREEVSREFRPVQNEVRKLSRYDPEAYIDALTRHEERKEPEQKAAQAEGSEGEESATVAYGAAPGPEYEASPEPEHEPAEAPGEDGEPYVEGSENEAGPGNRKEAGGASGAEAGAHADSEAANQAGDDEPRNGAFSQDEERDRDRRVREFRDATDD